MKVEVELDEALALIKMSQMLRNAGTPVPFFLRWIAERLVKVHGDGESVDFVQALRERALQIEDIASLLGVQRRD